MGQYSEVTTAYWFYDFLGSMDCSSQYLMVPVTLAGHHLGHRQVLALPPKLLAILSTSLGARVGLKTFRGSSGSYTERP